MLRLVSDLSFNDEASHFNFQYRRDKSNLFMSFNVFGRLALIWKLYSDKWLAWHVISLIDDINDESASKGNFNPLFNSCVHFIIFTMYISIKFWVFSAKIMLNSLNGRYLLLTTTLLKSYYWSGYKDKRISKSEFMENNVIQTCIGVFWIRKRIKDFYSS